MAPSALSTEDEDTTRGRQLEEVSDNIDAVNVIDSRLGGKSHENAGKDESQFRQYEEACDRVKDFYREQHEKQTVAFNLKARNDFRSRNRAEMGIWKAMMRLNTLIDDSDPDASLSQIEHLLQTAEALRRDGKPRWMQLTGLIHDLGKLLYFFGVEGQWAVVGDTFPVGCAFDEQNIVLPAGFSGNLDRDRGVYGTPDGIYHAGIGLDNLMLSWGHDEYLYRVVCDQSVLPPEALAIIRYHSFYPWHSRGAYTRFMNSKDEEMLKVVREFKPYDLYSKAHDIPSVEELKPYYLGLIDGFFPQKVIKW